MVVSPKRLSFRLPSPTYDALVALSRSRKRPVGRLVRDAIDAMLASRNPALSDPELRLLKTIAAGVDVLLKQSAGRSEAVHAAGSNPATPSARGLNNGPEGAA